MSATPRRILRHCKSSSGPPSGKGTVFKIIQGGTLTTLYCFCSQSGCPDGNSSLAALTTLYSFCSQSGCTDGDAPYAGLVQATDGNFYGTTVYGGANGGYGTVFKITPGGTLTTLYSFCSQSGCTDGAFPEAGLVQAANGDLYGTAEYGGAKANANSGTVFKITPSGTLTTLYSFCSQGAYPYCTDGRNPYAGLVQAANGDFYGTTLVGGTNRGGTVFRITPGGTLTTLYSFCSQSGCTDGAFPEAGLVQDTNGDFYGTTSSDGSNNSGTVFRLSVGLGPFVKPRPPYGKVGAAVKILGTNLTGATSVGFNGTAAVFEVVSSSEITTTVPAGSSSGKVQVVTPSGTLSSNASFLVVP
jgi:uncharacterized repeat protein (TIGR03803 family)